MFENVNLVAVLLAGVLNMVLGFVWYGPLFGKLWMKLSGLSQEKVDTAKKKGMQMTYLWTFVGALVTAYVLSLFVNYQGAVSATEGAVVGLWAAVGFVATTHLSTYLYEGKPLMLYKINVGYHVVSLMLMGALLTVLG